MTKDQDKVDGSQEKSKSQLRAERREKQEAQRAAKAGKKQNDPSAAAKQAKSQEKGKVDTQNQQPGKSQEKGGKGEQQQPVPVKSVKFSENKPQTVYYSESDKPTDVLGQSSQSSDNTHALNNNYDDNLKNAPEIIRRQLIELPVTSTKQQPAIHGAFHQLGLQMASGSLLGSDAQCIATVDAFKRVEH